MQSGVQTFRTLVEGLTSLRQQRRDPLTTQRFGAEDQATHDRVTPHFPAKPHPCISRLYRYRSDDDEQKHLSRSGGSRSPSSPDLSCVLAARLASSSSTCREDHFSQVSRATRAVLAHDAACTKVAGVLQQLIPAMFTMSCVSAVVQLA